MIETPAPSLRSGGAVLGAIAGLVAIANIVALNGSATPLAFAGGITLMCLIPGYLLAWLVLPGRDDGDGVDRIVFGLGLGVACMTLGGLFVHYVPGPVTPALVVGAFDLLVLVLLVSVAWRRVDLRLPPVPREATVHLLIVVIVAAALRLPDLGYAEFQGDEATIMLKSAAAVQGRADVLFVHKKGPAEILVPTLFYGLEGHIDETTARLPFALITMAGLLALYQLGRSMFGPQVGLVAALILAANGFFVAFARIVQYQGVVFLMSTLAVLAAWRYGEDRPAARRFLGLSVLFVAIGLLAHYDALLVLPAVAGLVLARWRRRPTEVRRDLGALVVSGAIAGAILAVFYVPMVRHPYFRESTWKYLFELRLGGADAGTFRNTLDNALALATWYSSTYYMALLAALLLAGIAHVIRGWRGVAVAMAIGLGATSLLVVPGWWRVGANDWGIAFLVLATAVLVAWRGPSPAWKTLILWLAAGVVFYTALIKSPRTHFHVAFPPWSLLAGVAVYEIGERLRSPLARRVWAGALVAAYAACCWYIWLVFVQHDVEYRRVFPAAYPSGYWRPPVELPSNGWFGFPYRAGWPAIGQLYHDGVLQGTYWSNEEENVTDWYTRGAPRCDVDPQYYFVAEDVQDARPIPADLEAAGFGEIGRVTTEGRARIRIYERGAGAAPAPVQTIPVEAIEDRFAREISEPDFEPGLPYVNALGFVPNRSGERGWAAGSTPRVDPSLGGAVILRGYALDTARPAPGGELVMTLYWESAAPTPKDYSVFVHLVDAGEGARTVAQSDGSPGLCRDVLPTTTWQPGRIYVDRRVLRLPAGTPPGPYALELGMYDYETMARLRVSDLQQAESADRIRIDGIEVAEREP